MTNPRYVYMPVWRNVSRAGCVFMLDGSAAEVFVINLDSNHIVTLEPKIKKVFFSVGDAVSSWQDEPKDSYGVIQIDLDTGEWERVL